MRRGWTLALTFATVVALGAPSAHAAEKSGKRYSVAAIGDSLTDARSRGGKYLEYLKRRCPESRFDNYGRGGETVLQMRRRFSREVLGIPRDRRHPRPQYGQVIVFGGVNDLLRGAHGRPARSIITDLDAMYRAAEGAGVSVIGVTLSPWAGYTRYYNAQRAAATGEVNAWIRGQGSAGRLTFVLDSHQLLACGDEGRLCADYELTWIRDGLHFNQAAHERLGEALISGVFSDCS